MVFKSVGLVELDKLEGLERTTRAYGCGCYGLNGKTT